MKVYHYHHPIVDNNPLESNRVVELIHIDTGDTTGSNGCGSNISTQNGTLANGNMDDLTCGPIPVGLILTHT